MIPIIIRILMVLIWLIAAIVLLIVTAKHKNVVSIILYILFLVISITGVIIVSFSLKNNTLYDTPEAAYENMLEDGEKIGGVVEGTDSCMLFLVSEDTYGTVIVNKEGDKYCETPLFTPINTRTYIDRGEYIDLSIDNIKGSADYYACLAVYGVKEIGLENIKAHFGSDYEVYRDSEDDMDFYLYHLSEFPEEATVEVNGQIVEWASTEYSTSY